MAVYTAIYSAEMKVSGSWEDVTDLVLDVSGNVETARVDNGLAFGDSSSTRISLRGLIDLLSYTWELTPIRVTFGINAVSSYAFYGVVTGRDYTLDELTFDCEGYSALISDTKAFSPMFVRKPAATKTTAASVEDPSEPAYAAGPINWILWQAGGRPIEQDFNGTYVTDARFWYSCDQALLSPDFSWFAGEDGWEEALKLVQASGGQLYQDQEGIVRYRQPYTIADNAPGTPYEFTISNFKDIRVREATRKTMEVATCSFVPRFLRPTQDVAEDTTSRLIAGSESVTFDLEPKWPLYSLEQASEGQLAASCFTVSFLSGSAAAMDTDFEHELMFTAQKITLTVTNLTGRPIELSRVVLRGEPVAAGEAGSVSVGSGTKIKEILAGNPYIQSLDQAERGCQLYLAFYGDVHPTRTLTGCVYNPARTIGEIVTLTVAAHGLSEVLHVITAIRHSQTGAEMEVDLVEIEGVHKTSDFYIVGVDYTGVSDKLVGY